MMAEDYDDTGEDTSDDRDTDERPVWEDSQDKHERLLQQNSRLLLERQKNNVEKLNARLDHLFTIVKPDALKAAVTPHMFAIIRSFTADMMTQVHTALGDHAAKAAEVYNAQTALIDQLRRQVERERNHVTRLEGHVMNLNERVGILTRLVEMMHKGE